MSRWDRLIARIRVLATDIRFEELKKVLEQYGYTDNVPRGGSSHHTFKKSGKPSLTIPNHSPVLKTYVVKVKKIVEDEEGQK